MPFICCSQFSAARVFFAVSSFLDFVFLAFCCFVSSLRGARVEDRLKILVFQSLFSRSALTCSVDKNRFTCERLLILGNIQRTELTQMEDRNNNKYCSHKTKQENDGS